MELKPCPFCGAEAELYRWYPLAWGRGNVTVRCTVCRANIGKWGRADKAIEAWNRRADDGTD